MSWMGWFGGGRNDHKESARNAIVELRSQLLMLEKREDHIQKQIDEETRKAKANATSNQRCKSACGPVPSTWPELRTMSRTSSELTQ
jgi:charged multivesicular body protein 4